MIAFRSDDRSTPRSPARPLFRSRLGAARARLALAAVVLLGSTSACRRTVRAGSGDEAASGTAVAEPPPLDTNWQSNPGRLLAAGDRAPDFEGIAHTGMRVKLSGFGPKPVVVYFFPGDGSPEGIAEARAFRDGWMRFNEKIGAVIGVSLDDRALDYDFATGERLPFLLVADPDGHIARAFGVGVDQGRMASVAFIVGGDGKITRVFAEAAPDGHANDVITAIESPGP